MSFKDVSWASTWVLPPTRRGPWSSTERNRVGYAVTPLYVGDAGNGSLTVQNGATGSAQGLQTYIANQQDTQGTVTITGAGSTWTNRDSLYIGYGGTGA